MTDPFARPLNARTHTEETLRGPRVFAPEAAADAPQTVTVLEDMAEGEDPHLLPAERPRRNWLVRIAVAAMGILLSLAFGVWVDHLIRDLFAAQPWLGWVAMLVAGTLAVAAALLFVREARSLSRLRRLDRLRQWATTALTTDRPQDGKVVSDQLLEIYAHRPALARARDRLGTERAQIFDGGEHVRLAERLMMAPLDAEARALTASSARRVALVTTVSPRALVDIAFVIYESIRLGSAIARLYGARPGLMGTLRLLGAIAQHLAVTGGLVLTDGVMEQLVGQGLAAKLSARLGEGVVNGLMTVRVGIAAMRVVRPLPYVTVKPPMVRDFVTELVKVLDTPRDR